MTRRAKTILAAGLLALGLGACASTPLYAPQVRESGSGYSEQRLDEDQYRVTFTGRRSTSRERVEDALILRAAEVTRSAGYTHFMIDQRQTDQELIRRRGPIYTGPDFFALHGGFGGRYYGRYGYGWYDPFWRNIGYYWDDYERTRYVAYADIALLTAEEARGNRRAISADDVIRNLRDKVAPPPRV